MEGADRNASAAAPREDVDELNGQGQPRAGRRYRHGARTLRARDGSAVPTLELASKERYFAMLSALVGKLEDPGKNMREVLSEMMAEAGRHLMEELSGPH